MNFLLGVRTCHNLPYIGSALCRAVLKLPRLVATSGLPKVSRCRPYSLPPKALSFPIPTPVGGMVRFVYFMKFSDPDFKPSIQVQGGWWVGSFIVSLLVESPRGSAPRCFARGRAVPIGGAL